MGSNVTTAVADLVSSATLVAVIVTDWVSDIRWGGRVFPAKYASHLRADAPDDFAILGVNYASGELLDLPILQGDR